MQAPGLPRTEVQTRPRPSVVIQLTDQLSEPWSPGTLCSGETVLCPSLTSSTCETGTRTILSEYSWVPMVSLVHVSTQYG